MLLGIFGLLCRQQRQFRNDEEHFDANQPCIVTVRSGKQSMWGDDVGPDGAEHPSNTDNNSHSISSTQWIVVKYVGKKSFSYFLGQVLEVVDDGIEVSLSHVSHVVTVYTNFCIHTSCCVKDIDVVTRDDNVDTPKHQPDMNIRQQFVVKHQKFTLH